MTTDVAEQFVTGIRVIDVFAPIALNSVCRMPWRPRTAAIVLTAELILRFVRSGGHHVVCAGYLDNAERLREWRAEMKEYELDKTVTDRWLDAESTGWPGRFGEAVQHAHEQLRAGHDVLFMLLQADGRDAWGEKARKALSGMEGAQRFVVLTLADYGREEVCAPDAGACTTRIVLDPARARAAIYPAIDPVTSTSTARFGGWTDRRRISVAERSRAAFAAYAEYDPGLQQLSARLRTAPASKDAARLMRLFECCAQPMYVAAPYTGIEGTSEPLRGSVRAFERAMRG